MTAKQPLDFDEFPAVSSSGWELKVRGELKNDDFAARMNRETWDGLSLRALYSREDLAGYGEPTATVPIVRSTMRGSIGSDGCEKRLDIATSDVGEANQIARTALASGVTSICFYSRINDQRIRGVAISHQEDMARLVAGIDLTQINMYFDWGLHAPAIVALFLNEAKRQGIHPQKLRGGLLFDPIAEMLPAGSYCGRPENLYRRLFRLYDTVRSEFSPAFHPLTIKGHPYHQAGGNAVQELAYAMNAAVTYVDCLTEHGVPLVQALDEIRFSFALGAHFIPEIAKLRAARLLWHTITKAYATERNGSPSTCHIHVRTSRVGQESLTPRWNIPRTTLAVLAAMSAGCNAISASPFDEAAGEPTIEAYAASWAIPELMEREALLGRILDPFGGAYAIESLTIDIAKQALSLFQRTELAGGLIAALAAGDIQREISKIRHHKEKLLACGQETMIGINAFASQLAQVPHPTKKEVVLSNDSNNDNRLMIDPYAVEQLQIALRDGVGLADLTGIAYRSAETFQFEPLRPYRASAPFEKIRMASARAANERLKPITALLIQEGCDALVAGRSVLVRQVMASCGFTLNECRLEDSRSQEETYQLASEADIVVLAALDDRYPILAKEVFCELNRNHPAILKMVAGYPVGCVETLRSFGTDDFIHAKGHIVEFYLRHARRLGVNL